MGTGGLSLLATDDFHICDYVHQWLSNLSDMDGEKKVLVENISNETPLSDVLRTEHTFMALYGELETTYRVGEEITNDVLKKNPTVQGVCDLVMHIMEERH